MKRDSFCLTAVTTAYIFHRNFSDALYTFLGENVAEYPVTLLSDSDIIDTNGAGDGFVGGECVITLICIFKYILQSFPVTTFKCYI